MPVIKLIIDQLVYHQLFQRYLKKVLMGRQKLFVIKYHQNDVVLEKGTLHIMNLDIPKNWLKFSSADVVAMLELMTSSLQVLLGFDNTTLVLMAEYLTNHFQSETVWSTFHSYIEILKGIAQGLILGIILLNHFIDDFVFCTMETEVHNLQMRLLYILTKR